MGSCEKRGARLPGLSSQGFSQVRWCTLAKDVWVRTGLAGALGPGLAPQPFLCLERNGRVPFQPACPTAAAETLSPSQHHQWCPTGGSCVARVRPCGHAAGRLEEGRIPPEVHLAQCQHGFEGVNQLQKAWGGGEPAHRPQTSRVWPDRASPR